MFMSKMETFIVLIWSSRHRMPHSLRDSHCFIFVNPKFKSKSLSQQTPTKSKASTIISQAMPWLSNANIMTANWPILILIIDGTNNIRCFHNLTTCNFRRQGFTLSCRSIFSCEDTALQVLMSVCVSVVNWYFQLYTTSRMFQNAPECMPNVPVCSRITVELDLRYYIVKRRSVQGSRYWV